MKSLNGLKVGVDGVDGVDVRWEVLKGLGGLLWSENVIDIVP